jgi:deoxycytidine triphosphate deaminase
MLSDKDIRALLVALDFAASHGDEPFRAAEQIQPCSVDLRLDNVFWLPRWRNAIDLRRARLLEIEPRRYYKKVVLKRGEHLTLRPRQLILARIYEEFTLPPGYSGDIIARSSFARMGLMINCSGGFINPGWRGHMPLQLVNFNSSAIRVFPFLPICQLRLFKLISPSERVYGETEIQSKYMSDDGGPSYWWRDKRIERLHKALGEVHVAFDIQERLLHRINTQEPELIERLERHLDRLNVSQLASADFILESFAKQEDKRRFLRMLTIKALRAAFPLFLTIVVANVFNQPWSVWHSAFVTAACLTLPISVYAFRAEVGEHFGRKELARSASEVETA